MQKNKKTQKKMAQQAKQAIGNKRPRPVTARAVPPPVSIPVRNTKPIVNVMSRSVDSTVMSITQPFHDIQNVAAAVQGNVLINNTLATNYTGTFMSPLCPSALNGSVQAEAQIWTNFRFKSMTFIYTPTCPTTQPGAVCFGTSDAPASVAGTDIQTFSTARSVKNAVTTSVYQPLSWSIMLNSDDRVLRINDGAITGGTLDKLLYNKVFFGITDIPAPAVTTINYGYLDIVFVIEFTQLMTAQGFTLQASSMEEKLVLASIRDTLFPKRTFICPLHEPVDGVNFLLSKLGLKKEDDARSNSGSVKSWVSGGR